MCEGAGGVGKSGVESPMTRMEPSEGVAKTFLTSLSNVLFR